MYRTSCKHAIAAIKKLTLQPIRQWKPVGDSLFDWIYARRERRPFWNSQKCHKSNHFQLLRPNMSEQIAASTKEYVLEQYIVTEAELNFHQNEIRLLHCCRYPCFWCRTRLGDWLCEVWASSAICTHWAYHLYLCNSQLNGVQSHWYWSDFPRLWMNVSHGASSDYWK